MGDLFGGGGSSASGGSDLGTAISSAVSGMGSGLSDMAGGLSNMAGGAGADLSSLASNVASAFSPSSAFTQTTDPTGSVGASQAINPPAAGTPDQQSSSVGGTQSGGAPTAAQPNAPRPQQQPQQFAPQSAIQQLAKLLRGEQHPPNPYVPGGNEEAMARAASISTAPVTPGARRKPVQDADRYDSEGASFQPEYGPGVNPYDSEGESNQPEYGPNRTPQEPRAPYPEGESNQPEYGPGRTDLPAVRGGVPATTSGGKPPEYLDTASGGSLSDLPTLARLLPGGLLRTAVQAIMQPTPADTGELKYPKGAAPTDYPGSTNYPQPQPGAQPTLPTDYPGSTNYPQPQPGIIQAPATGKPIKTVDPKTNKPVDPTTGAPLPTKKGQQPQPGEARDREWRPAGQPQSGPQSLMQSLGPLMPLLSLAASALMGGMGGGRRGGFGRGFGRGFGGFGHPGGRGMWPYHHPTFGWRMHGYHPGGGWLPMAPSDMQAMRGGQQGGGQVGQQGGGSPRETGERVYPAGETPYSGAIPGVSAKNVDDYTRQVAQQNGIDPDTASRFVGMESNYGQARRPGDNGTSFGPFQLHFAADGKAMGDQFMRDTGLDPRDPSTWKAQIDYAMKQAAQGGWGPWQTTMGKLGLNRWSGINRNLVGSRGAPGTPPANIRITEGGKQTYPSPTETGGTPTGGTKDRAVNG
jgi:hypothetical protein